MSPSVIGTWLICGVGFRERGGQQLPTPPPLPPFCTSTPAASMRLAWRVSATASGSAQAPVPGISFAAGTPPSSSASVSARRSATHRAASPELVPKIARPACLSTSQRLWAMKRPTSGSSLSSKGVNTGAITPRSLFVMGGSVEEGPRRTVRRRHCQNKEFFGSGTRRGCTRKFGHMDTRYLQSFVAVVELGSMAEAARRLALTPAAIAARVKALEDDIGVPLVQRAGRSVRPTEAGLKMLDRARNVLRDVRDLRAATPHRAFLRKIRLGVFISALTGVLPPVLERLYARFPDLSVFVAPGSSVELCRQVANGALDAAIVVEPHFPVRKGCTFGALREEPLVVVAREARAHRAAHALLAAEPFIRYDRSVLGGQLADRYLRDHGIRVRQRLEIDSLMAVAALVGQGLGVALLPDWAPMWRAGMRIARVPLPERAPVRRLGLIWAAQGPHAALAQALLAEAKAVCG